MFSPQIALYCAAKRSWHKGPALNLQMPRLVYAQAPGNTKVTPPFNGTHSAPTADDCAMLRVSLAAVGTVEVW